MNAVIVISVINRHKLAEIATNENEERFYLPFMNQFHSVLYDANQRLVAGGKKVFPALKLVKRDDTDEKFFDLVETKLGNFASQVDLRENKYMGLFEDDTESTGANPVNAMGENNDMTMSQSKPKVKTLVPKGNHHGFSNFTFICLVLILSIVFGIGTALLLIK